MEEGEGGGMEEEGEGEWRNGGMEEVVQLERMSERVNQMKMSG